MTMVRNRLPVQLLSIEEAAKVDSKLSLGSE
jgi:hypothetical protein